MFFGCFGTPWLRNTYLKNVCLWVCLSVCPCVSVYVCLCVRLSVGTGFHYLIDNRLSPSLSSVLLSITPMDVFLVLLKAVYFSFCWQETRIFLRFSIFFSLFSVLSNLFFFAIQHLLVLINFRFFFHFFFQVLKKIICNFQLKKI